MKDLIFILFSIKLLIILQSKRIRSQSEFDSYQHTRSPCPTGALQIFSTPNAPIGKKNRWQGTIILDQWPNEDHIMLELHLSHTAKLLVGDLSNRVISTKYIHRINMNESTSLIKRIHFEVDGKPNQGFPEPTGLYLNGFDICNCTNYCQSSDLERIQISTIKPNMKQSPTETPTRITLENMSTNTVSKNNYASITDVKINNLSSSSCGQRRVFYQNLIKHGYDTQPGEYPWHSAIFLRKESDSPNTNYICGGSLVSKSVVITAAHCVHESDYTVIPQRLLVKLGLHNRLLASSNTQEFRVYEILMPEMFNAKSSKNDIALLKLSNFVQFTDYIKPICLWPENDAELNSIIGKSGMVIGWGLDDQSRLSNVLKAAKMPVISQINCLEANRAFFGEHLSVNNYCAGYRNGTSVCNGDSGGGMVFQIRGIFYLRGIVSLAEAVPEISECNPREYVLFTDTAKYSDFIRRNIQN